MQTVITINTWSRRTNAEVEAEISKLSSLIDLVPGNENRKGVQAQIYTIAARMTVADIAEEFDDDLTDVAVLSAALDAAEWLWDGGEAASSDGLRMIRRTTGMEFVN